MYVCKYLLLYLLIYPSVNLSVFLILFIHVLRGFFFMPYYYSYELEGKIVGTPPSTKYFFHRYTRSDFFSCFSQFSFSFHLFLTFSELFSVLHARFPIHPFIHLCAFSCLLFHFSITIFSFFCTNSSPILSFTILSHSILSYSILSYSILSHSVLSYSIQSYSIPFCPLLSHSVLSYSIQSYSIPFCPLLSHTLLSYPILG